MIHALGLITFALAIVFAIRQSPPDLARIDATWLALSGAMAAVSLFFQATQTMIFLRSEHLIPDWRWALWFTAEKAWINTVFPAKAGTAGAMLYLRKVLDLKWHRYLKFMLVCGVLTASASAAGVILLLWPEVDGVLIALACFVGLAAVGVAIYPLKPSQVVCLAGLTLLSLVALTVGVGAGLRGLAHGEDLTTIIPVGLILNLLSVVAVTPGNFGFREAVLAALAPLLTLDFGIIVQASTCYVFFRLVISLAIATLFRTYAAANLKGCSLDASRSTPSHTDGQFAQSNVLPETRSNQRSPS